MNFLINNKLFRCLKYDNKYNNMLHRKGKKKKEKSKKTKLYYLYSISKLQEKSR